MMVNRLLLEMMVQQPMQPQMKLKAPVMNLVVEVDNVVKIILVCYIHLSVKQLISPSLNEMLQEWPVNVIAIAAILKLVNTSS